MMLCHAKGQSTTTPARSREARAAAMADMDESLMVVVNVLGVFVFVSIVGYHYVTANPLDLKGE